MRDPEKLRVYRQALALAVHCGWMCRRFPAAERVIVPQIRRSANSVHANIAEGSAFDTVPQRAHFTKMACGSARELKSHLREVIGNEPDIPGIQHALIEATSVAAQLGGLVQTLLNSEDDPAPGTIK